jgi:hypothetical protein
MMRRVTTTIVMILAWATAAAQVEPEVTNYPRYTVEVIIFEYAEDVSAGTERFLPEEPPLPEADEPGEGERVFGDAGAIAESRPVPSPDVARALTARRANRPNPNSCCTSRTSSP